MDNTYSLEDIFSPSTVADFKNSSKYHMAEITSMFFGRCHTACYLNKVGPKVGPQILFKTDFDVKVFFHVSGAELWISGAVEFPVDVAFNTMEIKNGKGINSAVISVKEIESIYLSKDEEPCLNYNARPKNAHEIFIDCCRANVVKNFLQVSISPTFYEQLFNT